MNYLNQLLILIMKLMMNLYIYCLSNCAFSRYVENIIIFNLKFCSIKKTKKTCNYYWIYLVNCNLYVLILWVYWVLIACFTQVILFITYLINSSYSLMNWVFSFIWTIISSHQLKQTRLLRSVKGFYTLRGKKSTRCTLVLS